LEIAAEHGVPVEALCREVGLSLADLDDPELRIPYALLDTLLERGLEMTGDDNLGLHMARMAVVDPDDVASLVIHRRGVLPAGLRRAGHLPPGLQALVGHEPGGLPPDPGPLTPLSAAGCT
jgi:hypothetical protein